MSEVLGKQSGKVLDVAGAVTYDGGGIILHSAHYVDNQLWKLEKTAEQTTDNIPKAYRVLEDKRQQLKQANDLLKLLNAALIATPADKVVWDARLVQLLKEIATLQTELNTLNTNFIDGVKNIKQTPQTMSPINALRLWNSDGLAMPNLPPRC